MSKAALNMAVSSAAIDLKNTGVTVIGVHPGWVQTDMGGPNAQVSVDDSAKALLATIDGLSHSDNGRFVDRDGGAIPW
jgi:NAD(P)-dependent dehydrogenase (short-subunit alcohol dehydrogenase family)